MSFCGKEKNFFNQLNQNTAQADPDIPPKRTARWLSMLGKVQRANLACFRRSKRKEKAREKRWDNGDGGEQRDHNERSAKLR